MLIYSLSLSLPSLSLPIRATYIYLLHHSKNKIKFLLCVKECTYRLLAIMGLVTSWL